MTRAALYATIGLALALSPAAWARDGAAEPAPSYVTVAAAYSGRAADVTVDLRRKGPELMALAGVKPGDKVLELIPGGGYFTRLFSRIVGPGGHVYTVWPAPYAKEAEPDVDGLRALAGQSAWNNISVAIQPADALTAPAPVDLVFTSQNYHDYPDKFMGRVDPMVLDRAVFRALKPGGVFLVIDHAAQAGSGLRDTDTLHRIDPQVVKDQARQAGFVLEQESSLLRNPADDHKLLVFDKAIRGRTDQFVLKFRKPPAR